MTSPPPDLPGLTYEPVGATAREATPPGFDRLHVRTRIGSGEAVFRTAARALMEWRVHRRMGVRITTEAPRAVRGAVVGVGLGVGPFRVSGPCRVVWTVEGEREAGWGYGTLRGHPQRGEEAFRVRYEEDGSVWLTVCAYSGPAVWFTRAGGPLVRLFQRAYARRCGQAVRALVRAEAGRGDGGRERGGAER